MIERKTVLRSLLDRRLYLETAVSRGLVDCRADIDVHQPIKGPGENGFEMMPSFDGRFLWR
jgi:hypothetical protein